jgi:hypothetical protein
MEPLAYGTTRRGVAASLDLGDELRVRVSTETPALATTRRLDECSPGGQEPAAGTSPGAPPPFWWKRMRPSISAIEKSAFGFISK